MIGLRLLHLLLVRIVVFSLTLYQKTLSYLFGQRCRFYPSCSEYAILSVNKYGIFYGCAKSLQRLCKCQPFHPGGVDYP